jgi:hypothetical protein
MSLHFDPTKLSERARPLVEALLRLKAAESRLHVSRTECMKIDPHGLSKQIMLENAGEYNVFIDGGQKRIFTDSIYDRMIRAVIATYPIGAAPRKAREVSTKFKKKARKRTAAELAGLAKANARRAEEARLRRKEAVAAAEI